MIKWLIRFVVLIVVVFIAINLAGNILVEKVLAKQLGVKVRVGKLSIDPIHQEAAIFALKIGNPESFEQDLLASIPEIAIQFDLKALLKKQVLIKVLRLQISEVIIEKNIEGKFNLIELNPVKSQFVSNKKEEGKVSKEESPSSGKIKMNFKVLFEDVYVAVGKAKYIEQVSGQPVVKEVNLGMKEFALDDVSNTDELVKQIAYRMMQSIGLNQVSAVLKNEASERLGAFMDKVRESMNF